LSHHNNQVAVAFGHADAAWKLAAGDAANSSTPKLVKVVESAVAKNVSKTGTATASEKAAPSNSTQDLTIKVRHKDTRRMRVAADITIKSLESRIAGARARLPAFHRCILPTPTLYAVVYVSSVRSPCVGARRYAT
jgi:hypothetical protein